MTNGRRALEAGGSATCIYEISHLLCARQGHPQRWWTYGNEILLEENILDKLKEKFKVLNMLQIPHTTQQVPTHNMQKNLYF